jgi:hypothetical protein
MLIVAWVMSDPVNCELRLLVRLDLIFQVCGVLARPMFDWPELRADGPIFGSHCLVEEQLLQIKFDWLIRLANGYRNPHLLPTAMIRYMVSLWGPGETHVRLARTAS